MVDVKVDVKTLVISIFLLAVVFTNTACMQYGLVNDSLSKLPPDLDQDVRRAAITTLNEIKTRPLDPKDANKLFESRVKMILLRKGVPSSFKFSGLISKFPNKRFVVEYKIGDKDAMAGSMFVLDADGNEAKMEPGEEPKSKLFDNP